VPERIAQVTLQDALGQVFAKYDPVALGTAVGSVASALIFMVTAILLVRGGDVVGPTLSLLGNYFLGYEVSWPGAFLGLVETGIGGFAFGYGLASMINRVISRELRQLLNRVEGMQSMDLFEGDEL
jgi:hypothetical protein